MYLYLPWLLLLSALLPFTDAHPQNPVARAANQIHRRAIKRSAGLARDIRVAFGGMVLDKRANGAPGKVYCVNNPNFNGTTLPNANDNGNGTSNASPQSSTHPPRSSSSGHGSPSATGSSGSPATPTGSAASSSPWKLKQSYQGSSFFDGWDFFTGSDPTNGQVTYVDQNTAQSANLIDINDAGNAVMRVETTPQVQSTRQSVRISSKLTYTGALVIMDSVHMPTGCGTWPAFWSNGPNWPAGGEIDIVEGVHDYTNNQATIHTNPGCTIPAPNGNNLAISGTLVGGTNCAASQTGNQGCGVRASQSNSFGAAFNNIGGGVYAMLWDNDGVAIYFFPRNAIPDDINASAPQPTQWGTPMAFWPAATCNPFQFFYSHTAIFDTTLCGDWASGVWGSSGIPGQEQSCAQRTGVATCEDFVRNNGGALSEAYWEVKSVKIYQTS